MSDLAGFLKARIDEDEAAAREIHEARICSGCSDGWEAGFDPDRCDCGYPARALREVAAKRAILDEHAPEPWGEPHPELLRCAQGHGDEYWTLWPCAEVRAVAAVWSDHPDYRQERKAIKS